MKIKNLVLCGFLLLLSTLPGVAQQGSLNSLFDELQQNIDIGALVRLNKGKTSIIATRKYFMDRLQDTTMLNWSKEEMSPFSRDITKEFNIGMDVDAVIDPVSAGFNVKINSDNQKILYVAKGYEKNSEIGEIAYMELLDALDVNHLKDVEDAMKKGGKAYLLTRVFYVDSGYVDIVDKKNTVIDIHVKIDSIRVNPMFGKNNKDSLNRVYKPNTAVAYKGIQITKNDIKKALCRKGMSEYCQNAFDYLPFGIHQFTTKQTGKGVLFSVSEAVLLGTGIGYCVSAHNNLKKHKNPEYEQWKRDRFYGKYENQLSTSGWFFAGALLATGLNYCDNFNWFRHKITKNTSVAIVPAPTFDWQGKSQMSMAMSINF